ncbi:MAG TPA: hypothetical protein VFF50_00750 [Candidatus Deferrimicrobiaceae bacterium]|nr:hypothetical protein [Candidatus Deferrimicrobiaceae bacterium]
MNVDDSMSSALRELAQRAVHAQDQEELSQLVWQVNVLLGLIENRLEELACRDN